MALTTTASADRCYALIESALVDYFTAATHSAAMISPTYLRLWKDIYSLVQAGGKRLRPRMVYLGYRAFGGTQLETVAPVAAATELLHLSMLIHDDIIDRDFIRYGVPNITARYIDHYTPDIANALERLHYAESSAILAGDLLLSGGHQMIAGSAHDDATKTALQAIMSRSVFEVAAGELLDTEAAFVDPAQVQPLLIARYKTAGYSFISPLLIGATAAGADEAVKSTLRQFAEHLGIAFQLQDDLISVFGNSVVTGKSTTGDLREGKRTYLIECFYKTAAAADRVAFETQFGTAGLDDAAAAELRQLLINSGAQQMVQSKISELRASAIEALAALSLADEYHQEFLELIDKAVSRKH